MNPKIILGVTRDGYDQNVPLSRQQNVWCISLFSGDKFTGQKWKRFYQIDTENQLIKPKFGFFEQHSIVGIMLDMDRGFLNFYKDGVDLGQAFVSPDLKDGEFVPFI